MANKSDPVEGVTSTAAAVKPGDAPLALTLHEFCMRLSTQITKPELIAGFEHTERAAGVASDTHEAFDARFNKFINQPV